MIDSLQQDMEAIFNKVIRELSSSDEKQIVSITKEIDQIEPLLFFEGAKQIGKNRTFWHNLNDGFVLAGAGNVLDVTAEQDRHKQTEAEINKLMREAFINNPYELPGTGLVLLGGMKFDPKRKTSELWEAYATSQFVLPEFLLTKVNERMFLTVNVLVRKEDHPAQLAAWLKQKEERLFAKRDMPAHSVSIQSKKEKDVEQWLAAIDQVKEAIGAGAAEKIVLAREMRLQFKQPVVISTVLQELIETQPNSYVFAFEQGDNCFVGATPERLVRVDQQSLLSTCLAGTAARGKTKKEDEKIGTGLLTDQKNREEHDFVVQMIKNAIDAYCTNVTIPDAPVLYRLKNLQHLYTPVTAMLKEEYSIFDIVEQLHPTPALGGTPTKDALAFIREHEPMDRGWYGAPIGWVDSNRSGEFAVAIRSGLIQGDEASLFAGCGIVKDSDPASEYEETAIKMLPMLSVLGGNKE